MKIVCILALVIAIAFTHAASDPNRNRPVGPTVFGTSYEDQNRNRPVLQSMNLGFDILTYEFKALLFNNTYNLNKTSPDNNFIIPDNTVAVPVFSSNLNVNSKIYSNWQNYTSSVFSSVSVSAHASGFFGIHIGGSYQQQNLEFRSNQQQFDSVMIETEYMTKIYSINSDINDITLTDYARQVIRDIKKNLENANHAMARYLMEVFIGNFGTEVFKNVVYGGSMKTYSITDSYFVKNSDYHSIMKSGSLSFSCFFGGINANAVYNTADTSVNNMMNYSRVFNGVTIGGKLKNNLTVEDFTNSLYAGEAAIIDGKTMSICNVIDNYSVQDLCFDVVKNYLDVNIPKGCTNMLSDNYNENAMFNDGSCDAPKNNFTFHGAYQTCVPASTHDNCNGYTQKNPRTNDFSCAANQTDVVVSSSQQITKTSIYAVCGTNNNDDPCVMTNILQTGAASNEIFVSAYQACTGTKEVPTLPGLSCGSNCHHVWFHEDCTTSCNIAINYDFGFCDIRNNQPFWCQLYAKNIGCYETAQKAAIDYFDSNYAFINIGHTFTVHLCTSTNSEQGFNIVGIKSNNINLGTCVDPKSELKLFNTFADDNSITLCINNDNVTPFYLPFGGIGTCQFNNPYTNNLDCAAGYSKYYTLFAGSCEVIICVDMSKFSRSFSKPVIKELPFMNMPVPDVGIHNYVKPAHKLLHSRLVKIIHNNIFYADSPMNYTQLKIYYDPVPFSNMTAPTIIIPYSNETSPSVPKETTTPKPVPFTNDTSVPKETTTPKPVPSSDNNATTANHKKHNNTVVIIYSLTIVGIIGTIIGFAYARYRKIQTRDSGISKPLI